jgi:hypothetical protein
MIDVQEVYPCLRVLRSVNGQERCVIRLVTSGYLEVIWRR